MKKAFFSVLVLCLLFAGTAFAQSITEVNSEPVTTHPTEGTTAIRVFQTTDIHGYLMDTSSMKEETFQYRMAYLSGVVNKAKTEFDGVILLNGGNNYEGTPVSNLLKGASIRAAFDMMGYDATALGNHEFDWGDDVVYTVSSEKKDATIGAYTVGEFSADPTVPVLACNLYYRESGDRVEFTKDYVIVEKAGYRIALIGYISDFSSMVMSERVAPFFIDTNIDHLKAKIEEINAAEKADLTILVTFDSPASLAAKMDPSQVTLVTGGHGGSSAGVADNGIAYLSGSSYVAGYACATIMIDNATGAVSVADTELVSLTKSGPGADNSHLYESSEDLDPQILALSKASWNAVKDNMEEVLGYIDTAITARGSISDNGATTAGNWVTGLMLRFAEKYGAVAAFYNNGGLRTSFNLAEGQTTRQITAADVYQINPFCNYWYVYEITGAELKQHLLNAFKNGNYGNEMSGLTFTFTQTEDTSASSQSQGAGGPGGPGGPGGSRKSYIYTIESVTLSDGTEVDLEDNTTLYRVCTSNYSGTLAGGVFENKTPIYSEAEAPIDSEMLIELLREEGKANNGYIAVDTGIRGTKVEK